MSNVFHDQIPDAYIAQVFQIMADLPRLRRTTGICADVWSV
jgi:protein gp37